MSVNHIFGKGLVFTIHKELQPSIIKRKPNFKKLTKALNRCFSKEETSKANNTYKDAQPYWLLEKFKSKPQ